MASIGKIAQITIAVVVAFGAAIGGKWYYTAAQEQIDPQEGIYGMSGLEVWIDLNARMPDFAREWGCTTLRAREKVVLGGQNSLPPYSCQPGFGTLPDSSTYDTIVTANLTQVTSGLDAAKAATIRACFDARMAAAVTPEEIAAVNEDPASASMQKVVLAISDAARACTDENP